MIDTEISWEGLPDLFLRGEGTCQATVHLSKSELSVGLKSLVKISILFSIFMKLNVRDF